MAIIFGKSSSDRTVRHFKRFFKTQCGVTSVEFAVAFTAFILVLLFLFETCRFISLVSTLDLSLAESGRLASRNKLNSQTYLDVFNKNLRDKNKTLMWLFFENASLDQVKMDIRYCNSIADIINDGCSKNNAAPLAIYNVSYNYSPAFFLIPNKVFNGLKINSNAVYVQEYAAAHG